MISGLFKFFAKGLKAFFSKGISVEIKKQNSVNRNNSHDIQQSGQGNNQTVINQYNDQKTQRNYAQERHAIKSLLNEIKGIENVNRAWRKLYERPDFADIVLVSPNRVSTLSQELSNYCNTLNEIYLREISALSLDIQKPLINLIEELLEKKLIQNSQESIDLEKIINKIYDILNKIN